MSLARMFVRPTRLFGQVLMHALKQPISFPTPKFPVSLQISRPISHLVIQHETVEEMICRYECIFGRDDADGWDVRQAMNDIAGYDSIPEPRIIIAGLHACRRLNDYALAVRFMEMVKNKCGNKVSEIYPYIVQEVGPTIAELGCDFPENLGYDKPELWLPSIYDCERGPFGGSLDGPGALDAAPGSADKAVSGKASLLVIAHAIIMVLVLAAVMLMLISVARIL